MMSRLAVPYRRPCTSFYVGLLLLTGLLQMNQSQARSSRLDFLNERLPIPGVREV